MSWLPVALAWLPPSATLARGRDPGRSHGWRVFITVQSVVSIGMVAALHWFSPFDLSEVRGSGAGEAVPVTKFGIALLGMLLLNVSLISANFESTYVALSARWRRAFSPAGMGIIFLLAWFLVVVTAHIFLRRLPLLGGAQSSG